MAGRLGRDCTERGFRNWVVAFSQPMPTPGSSAAAGGTHGKIAATAEGSSVQIVPPRSCAGEVQTSTAGLGWVQLCGMGGEGREVWRLLAGPASGVEVQKLGELKGRPRNVGRAIGRGVKTSTNGTHIFATIALRPDHHSLFRSSRIRADFHM
jgi:hypothetical protein